MLDQQVFEESGSLVAQQPSDEPRIEVEESNSEHARVIALPLRPGFGITLGNTLRRVLLSSLPGAAVTSVRITGVMHEFSAIPNVKEDTIEFLLNVKELRIRALSDRPGTLILDIQGREGEITAADIQVPEHYEIANPELHLATLDSADASLQVEFNVEIGRGYVPASQAEELQIGVIPVDAIFTPVRRANYQVERTRVGQATNYDKLSLEVWTDGTISGVDAVSRSADIMIEQFQMISQMGRTATPVVEHGLGAGMALPAEKYNMPIEDLNLSMRAYNCLRRSGLTTVGQVLEKSEEELLVLRNFGQKSYEELRDLLDNLGLLPEEDEVSDAPPIEEKEGPISAKVNEGAGTTAAPAGKASDDEMAEWQRQLLNLKQTVTPDDQGDVEK